MRHPIPPPRPRGRPLVAAVLAILAFVVFAGPAAVGAQSNDVAGTWAGALEVAGTSLRIVFHLERAADGSLTATLDSPDQGATGIPVSEATFADGKLKLDVLVARGVYQGTVAPDGETIEGTWTQSGKTFPLVLRRAGEGSEAGSPSRPQEPKPPFPYRVEDVTFENPTAGVTLAGTFTCPRGEGRHAAAILLSGSGPQDRDETIFGHRPFLVLADALTRAGIAVLRYDDRGVGKSTGDFAECTTRDFASDARAALAYMRSRPDVDPKRVGFVGHSEGGLVAPLVARDDAEVAFVVLLSAPALPGEEILYLQGELINRAGGGTAEAVARNRRAQERLFALAKTEKDVEKLQRDVRKVLEEEIDGMTEAEREALGDRELFIRSQTAQIASPWLRFFLTYDPRPALEALRCPVLALFGGKDLQVPAQENLAAMATALEEGGNRDHTLRVFPGLNHLYQHADTGLVSEYGTIEETFAPEALKAITDWVAEKTATTGG